MIAHPFIYEINTWPWLDELSRRCGRRVELGDVPGEVWDAIAAAPLTSVVTDVSNPPLERMVVGSVRPCNTIAAQIVPVTRMVRYMHMPNPNV